MVVVPESTVVVDVMVEYVVTSTVVVIVLVDVARTTDVAVMNCFGSVAVITVVA